VLKVLHFSHLVRGRHMLIRTDSVSAAAFASACSSALHRAAVKLWLWAHQNLLSLRALHIPGSQNVGADLMSGGGPRQDEWRLHPDIVKLIWRRFGVAQVGLFASRENTHCEMWFSLRSQSSPVGGKCDGACSLAADAFVCVPVTAADPPSSGKGTTGEFVTHSVSSVVPRAGRPLTPWPVAGQTRCHRPTDRFTTRPYMWGG